MPAQKNGDSLSPVADQPAQGSSRFSLPRLNLRTKFVLAVAVPVVVMTTTLSLLYNQRERHALEDQLRLSAEQMGEIISNSLHHAMLINDRAMINEILAHQPIETQIQILDLDGEVKASNQVEAVGTVKDRTDPGCVECHQFRTGNIPTTVKLTASPELMRVSRMIVNEPECTGCHADDGPVLGMLLMDVSLVAINRHLAQDFRIAVLISVVATVIFTVGLLWLIHHFVVRRMVALRAPLREFAAGNFGVRLPVSGVPPDEVDRMALTFNRMAADLEQEALEREERTRVQGRAIIEERERIARELHDGLAQLLAYINAKLSAVRLMLRNDQLDKANQNLLQLEEATRDLFVNVREAILSLRMASRATPGLVTALEEFINQYDRFCELPVDFHYAPSIKELALDAETELQLLRIAQEALTNVRKHASATRAQVNLDRDCERLTLKVVDDGVGFDPATIQDWSHYGLDAMRERAEAIGATFDLSSSPDTGTTVVVHLPLKEVVAHADSGRR
jgi:signal transduction histidine kinase